MDVEKQQQPPRARLAESAYASPVGAGLRGIGGRLCKIATSGRFGSVRSKARLPPRGNVILQRTITATACHAIISSHDMRGRAADHGLEFLLAFNGRIHHLEKATG